MPGSQIKETMKVQIRSSKLVKPFYEGNTPLKTDYIPLSVFDKVTYDNHIAIIYAYRPPTASNATIELGLGKALAEYREFAGRLGSDGNGEPIILLNDDGVRYVEASVDAVLDEEFTSKPSASMLSLHPTLEGVIELAQVQITRFLCGSMVVGFTSHHPVADANASSRFLVAWGKATRGLEMTPLPFHDRTIFTPRNPPEFEFYNHREVEYTAKNSKKVYPIVDYNTEDIVVHKVHFTKEFLSKLKAKASTTNEMTFSTFVSLVAHLWRAITKARGLNEAETTQVRISVDGRARLKLNPKVPNDQYFGNLVLWAFARSKVDDLINEPVSYAAKLLHEAIVNANDDYFKSFIDFANHKVKEEELVPTADTKESVVWPNLDVDSWLRFPFCDLDFGSGSPYAFMPSFCPVEGLLYFLPSFTSNGSIDVFVPLFRQNLTVFKQICYSLD